jgi:hypothetical protein
MKDLKRLPAMPGSSLNTACLSKARATHGSGDFVEPTDELPAPRTAVARGGHPQLPGEGTGDQVDGLVGQTVCLARQTLCLVGETLCLGRPTFCVGRPTFCLRRQTVCLRRQTVYLPR